MRDGFMRGPLNNIGEEPAEEFFENLWVFRFAIPDKVHVVHELSNSTPRKRSRIVDLSAVPAPDKNDAWPGKTCLTLTKNCGLGLRSAARVA